MDVRKLMSFILISVLLMTSITLAAEIKNKRRIRDMSFDLWGKPKEKNSNFTFNISSLSLNGKIEDVEREQLEKFIPETYQSTEEKIGNNSRRFILWTYDGEHLMWGNLGSGYFTAKDNSGKSVWGIYNKRIFAGFYDGKFFWGRFNGSSWKAEGLFGLEKSHGKYLVFPMAHPIIMEE
ncbi:MAG: hypothetical protein QXY45_01955 [Candidatus Aenigmatarchaeota archaeon]